MKNPDAAAAKREASSMPISLGCPLSLLPPLDLATAPRAGS
jgi:hypothetical protein